MSNDYADECQREWDMQEADEFEDNSDSEDAIDQALRQKGIDPDMYETFKNADECSLLRKQGY